MKCVVIFGNSGSGKTTLARHLAKEHKLQHLDLDDIAWESPGVRRDIAESVEALRSFITEHDEWVIEGSYGSLITEASNAATELIFLNPGVETCQENCRARPWESHKYPSKEAQDKNLEMLLNWVADYETRTDEFSLSAKLLPGSAPLLPPSDPRGDGRECWHRR